MLGQERLDAVGAEPAPVHVREQRTRAAARRFLEPCLEGASRIGGQRRTSFLSPFADASHMRAGAEMDRIPIEADQLGEAQACLGGEQHQGVIATSEPGRTIGSGKDYLDLGPRQEMHLTLVVALARYRDDTLDKGAVRRLLEGGEPEEGANSRQAQVARPDAGA